MKTKKTTWLLCLGLPLLALLMYQCGKAKSTDLGGGTTTPVVVPPPVVTVPPATADFVHPGVLNTKASLDLIASQANSGDAVRNAAYQKVLDFISSHTYPATFPATVVVGSNGATSPSKNQIRSDAELSYAIALRWAKTGDAQYATQAIFILNGWASTFQSYGLLDAATNANQPSLEAAWTTPSFVAAAEILRYYTVNGKGSGWADADIAKFSSYIGNINTNYLAKTPAYANNWNASAGYAQMAIGVFLSNKAIYQTGYNTLLSNFSDIIQPDGTTPELCVRQDCVHYQYSLTAYAYSAVIAAIQNDNYLWTVNSNRISAGYDYMYKAYKQNAGGCNYCSTSSPTFPGTEVAYNHLKTDNLKYLVQLNTPIGVPVDNTFLGFTTYTHANVPGL